MLLYSIYYYRYIVLVGIVSVNYLDPLIFVANIPLFFGVSKGNEKN